jgi:hypothetical protein
MPFLSSAEGQYGYGRQLTISNAILTTGLLLYLDAGNTLSYPGTGTTWTDLSINANNATSLTGFTYSSANGGFLSFNGSTGAGSLVANKYNTTYTGKTIFVAGKLNSLTTGTYRAILGSSAGSRNFNFYFYSPSNGVYQLHFSSGGGGTLSTNMSYTLGNWFTVAMTQALDGTTAYYLNGTLVNQTTQPFAQYLSGTTEHIGRADNFWDGPLAVIGVYNSALTAANILNNHNSVKSRYGL